MSEPVKVLVAEDHFVTREGLRRLLEEQDNIVVVGCAANPAEAMQLAQRTSPDVLVTDIRMPPTNTTEGIDLAHDIREMLPGCGVVVLSQHDDEEYVWALFAGAGFAALVAASEVGYLVLRVVGAAVLLYLGFRAFRAAWLERKAPQAQVAPPAVPGGRRWWGAFGEGVVVQLANPKAAVFMIAFYPQFVPADGPVFTTTALLGLLQITVETALYLGLAAGVARAGAWFRRPPIRRRLEVASGTVLVGLGLRVAVSTR